MTSSYPVGGTLFGAGVGVGLCLLLVVLAMMASIVVVVVVKKRAANKQTRSIKMRANPCYNNPVVVELEEKDVGAEYDDTVINKENGSGDGFILMKMLTARHMTKPRRLHLRRHPPLQSVLPM